ncbi:MAG: hypothetical protein IID51_12675 [Proteobacteria bacterium]|nr:hypothetical protein [Pseudomonadota bacterium]
MGVFEFIIVIVAITAIGGIVRDKQRIKAGYAPRFGRHRHRSRHRNSHSNGSGKGMDMGLGMGMGCPLCAGLAADGEGAEELEARLKNLTALEERVQVLEKIVTDKGRTLADEIDRL